MSFLFVAKLRDQPKSRDSFLPWMGTAISANGPKEIRSNVEKTNIIRFISRKEGCRKGTLFLYCNYCLTMRMS